MKIATSRRRLLLLASKFYELAAEFSDDELEALLHESSKHADTQILSSGIKVLMRLHKSSSSFEKFDALTPLDMPLPPALSKDWRENQTNSPFDRNFSRQPAALFALFGDRDAFPFVTDIAKVTGIPPRSKEARERYLMRLVKWAEGLTSVEREKFFNKITKELKIGREDFISNWSQLIKGL